MPPLGSLPIVPVTKDLFFRSHEDALPFFDSGRGSSVHSKQSSTTIDLSDDNEKDVSLLKQARVEGITIKKRKLWSGSQQQAVNDSDGMVSDLDIEAVRAEGLGPEEGVPTKHNKRICVGVRLPPSVHPRSQYEGYRHPLPKEQERYVVRNLLANERAKERIVDDGNSRGSTEFFHSYRLDDFTIYHPNDRRLGCEKVILSNLCVKGGDSILLFDGVLTDGEIKRYVEGVPFRILSVGNYADITTHDVSNSIWVQTDAGQELNVWYELGTPSSDYGYYYKPFFWLANFSKHVVDYLTQNKSVVLRDFKGNFSAWITAHHSGTETFDSWYAEFGRDDFRQAVAAHRDWLWNQAYCCSQRLTKHPVWDEVLHLKAVKRVPGDWIQETIVTPYVYQCFEHMFGGKMTTVRPPLRDNATKFSGVHVPRPTRAKRDQFGNFCRSDDLDIEVGDVVAINKDQGTEWTSKSTIWYAYVQGIRYQKTLSMQPYALDVIWLYAPEDTILSKERYPYHNELFFSDHCNCGEELLYAKDILNTLSIGFFKGPNESGEEFFIRQKYRTTDPAFLTLRKEDLSGCKHKKIAKTSLEVMKERYQPGDTVLVGAILDGKDILEPVEIFRLDEATGQFEVRVLSRRHTIEGQANARPNELVYTSLVVSIKPQFIHRRCHIRFVTESDVKAGKVPNPYGRDGTGDCFYISTKLDDEEKIKPFGADEFPTCLHQGFLSDVPPADLPTLNGLDLFCGGGNFGRGIEEGGVVNMKWAVDIDIPAIHSYAANCRNPDGTALYQGSINNYLRDAILGKTSNVIAAPGEVDFISAGSPCQGFSNANQHKFNEKSLRNCSLVASVATAVDVYRPLFGLLENVHGMATTRYMPDGREINVYSQLLCCLVGLGYQCQQFTLDAWSFGSAQSRTRLFLSIAAAGQTLPQRPPRSHEHPSTVRDKALFKAPNGQKFGGREMEGPCTFPAPTCREAFGDLPWLGNNHLGVCIPHPDHRVSRVEAVTTRMLMAHVPKHEGNRLANSWRGAMNVGKMPRPCGYPSASASKGANSCRSWSRIMEDALCRTITTTLTPQCSYTGQWVHYDQDRLITIMEARRAQSFPDDEVLIGNAAQVFKIVGNSVARSVALAWGIAIRYAYLGEAEAEE